MPQNPRRICVGRDLWRSSGLILCSEQDQLEQVAECHVDFQVLPRVKFYHLSKSALPTSWWTRVFLMFMLQWLEVENWTGFLQRLQCFHLWRYSKAASVWFWAASSRWPWLSRGTTRWPFPHQPSMILLCPRGISFVASCCITLTCEKSGSALTLPIW